MSNISYIRILQTIESFASEHLQVKKFASDFPSQMPNFATQDEAYPVLFVSPTSSIFNTNTNEFQIDVYCFDIIQKDRNNINTILSDTNQILNDLDKWLKEGDIAGIDVLTSTLAVPINNALLDYAAGWQMTINLSVDTYSVCEIPFNEVPVITNEVNNIVYQTFLTCETLQLCDTFTDAIDNLQEQIDIISGNTENFCNQLSGCTVIQDINSELSGLTSNINELSGQVLTNTSSIDILSGQNITQTSQINTLSGQVSTNTSNITALSAGTANYVPYTGATRDVDLGEHQLSVGQITFDQSPTGSAGVGVLRWNSADGTFDMGLLNGITLQSGQEIHMYAKASGTISNGDAVQFAGSQGSHLLIKKAVPSEINSNPEYFVGIATQDFANNQFGYVTVFGQVRDLDTSMYSGGTVLYYQSSGTTSGLLTNVRPTGPRAKITVAAVVRSHQNQGAIFVRPHMMPKIGGLQDIEISGATDGQILSYNATQEVWKNIDLPSPSIPTLQSVTDEGNITTNYVIISDGSSSTSIGPSSLYIENPTTYFDLSPDGIGIGDTTGDNYQTSIRTRTRTQNTDFYFEDEGGSKSIATREWVDDNKLSKSTGSTYTTNALLTVTQAEYDAIVTKDPTTLYFIV